MTNFRKNFDSVLQAIRNCWRRFPAPIAFATMLSAFLVAVIIAGDTPEALMTSIIYFLSVGFVLSLTFALWLEEKAKAKTKLTSAMQIAAYTLLLADAAYLYFTDFGKVQDWETFLMHSSVLLALALSVFHLSFLKEKDDIPLWNFTRKTALWCIVCFIVGVILYGGVCLLMASLDWLFSVKVGWKCYMVAAVLVAFYLPLSLFLGRVPEGEDKHDPEPLRSPFLGNVMRYLFVPLEGLYLLVLYVYALKIILQWELPNGHVSWLVIASVVGCIGIELGLYPVRKSEGRNFDEKVARYLPLALTPLLLLMTVGIIRRLSDYGITIARLYLITLNLWFYAVCIGLYVSRARRIHWVSLSFAGLFLLTSALPVNYTSITRHHMLSEVRRMLSKAEVSLPLNAEMYDKAMKSMPQEEAVAISTKLYYLKQTFNAEAIKSVVNEGESPINYWGYINPTQEIAVGDSTSRYYFKRAKNETIAIPEGYTRMENLVLEFKKCEPDTSMLRETIINAEGMTVDTLQISFADIKRLEKEMPDPVRLNGKNGVCVFVMMQYSGYLNSGLSLDGYLFTK